MNSPHCLRKGLAMALLAVATLGWQFSTWAQDGSKGQNPDRALKTSKPEDAPRKRNGETLSQSDSASSPRLVVQLGHSAEISSLAMTSDGRMILTAGDTTARLWDAETGKELRTF